VNRKGIGKRIRFEIFARDGFKCRYCGRQSDEVQLVLDHMVPVCRGGGDELENLITSCFECNAGKAGKTIVEHVPTDGDRLAREQEMREQERSLDVARRTAEARAETRQVVVDYLCTAYGVRECGGRDVDFLLAYYYQHGPEKVFEWIDLAASRVPIRRAGRYISGIRRRLIEEGEI
jgi:hypothetical protein